MNRNKLLNILVVILTIILLVSLSALNLYISIYYKIPNPNLSYSIKPYYFLLLIGILVIIQYILIYKIYYKRKW